MIRLNRGYIMALATTKILKSIRGDVSDKKTDVNNDFCMIKRIILNIKEWLK